MFKHWFRSLRSTRSDSTLSLLMKTRYVVRGLCLRDVSGQAEEYAQKAVHAGCLGAEHFLARRYRLTRDDLSKEKETKEFQDLLAMLQRAADAGDALASNELAWFLGEESARRLSVERLQASESPLAMFRLGDCHSFGFGVPRDRARAVQFYSAAANAGHALAQFKLGASSNALGLTL